MDKPLSAPYCVVSLAPRSVLELPWLERTLLWAIRSWAAYHDAPQPVWTALEQVFSEVGMHPALEPFGRMMTGVFAGLKRWPDIRCVRCLRLGKDEYELLFVLTGAVHAQQSSIEPYFKRLLLPAAARVATAAALEVVSFIHNAGWHAQAAVDIHAAADFRLLDPAPLHASRH